MQRVLLLLLVMLKINQINKWLKSRNDLEKTIIFIVVIALGIGGALLRRSYWDYRFEQCEQLNEYEVNSCKLGIVNEQMDSFMGL